MRPFHRLSARISEPQHPAAGRDERHGQHRPASDRGAGEEREEAQPARRQKVRPTRPAEVAEQVVVRCQGEGRAPREGLVEHVRPAGEEQERRAQPGGQHEAAVSAPLGSRHSIRQSERPAGDQEQEVGVDKTRGAGGRHQQARPPAFHRREDGVERNADERRGEAEVAVGLAVVDERFFADHVRRDVPVPGKQAAGLGVVEVAERFGVGETPASLGHHPDEREEDGGDDGEDVGVLAKRARGRVVQPLAASHVGRSGGGTVARETRLRCEAASGFPAHARRRRARALVERSRESSRRLGSVAGRLRGEGHQRERSAAAGRGGPRRPPSGGRASPARSSQAGRSARSGATPAPSAS